MHEMHAEPRVYAYIHSCNLAITRTLSPYKVINLQIHDTSKRRWKIDRNQYNVHTESQIGLHTKLYFQPELQVGRHQTLYCHTF